MVYCPAVELVPTASVVVSLLAAAVCIAAAAWARQAWPIGVRRVVEDLGQRVVAAETDLESLRREWQAKKLELEALDESVDGMLQSVEKKRRRIAALEAKQNGARLPVTALIDQFYAQVQARGGKRWDTCSLMQLLIKD